MIAQNIAYQAVLKGHSALFVTASQLLLDLGGQDSARGLDRRLRHYCSRTGLLAIDEVGYLSYDARNADLLFQVIRPPVRAAQPGPHHQPPFQRVAHHLPQRRLRHGADRPRGAPRRHPHIEGSSYRRRAAEENASARRKQRNS